MIQTLFLHVKTKEGKAEMYIWTSLCVIKQVSIVDHWSWTIKWMFATHNRRINFDIYIFTSQYLVDIVKLKLSWLVLFIVYGLTGWVWGAPPICCCHPKARQTHQCSFAAALTSACRESDFTEKRGHKITAPSRFHIFVSYLCCVQNPFIHTYSTDRKMIGLKCWLHKLY